MLAPSAIMPLLALSLDGVQSLVLDLYGRAQRDWWTTAYWGGVWACGFVVTFILLRMLFTHWGDRDVIKKTLGFSLLVHVLGGMLSTTVIFGPGTSPEGEPESPTVIRRVLVEGPPSHGDSDSGDPTEAAEGRNTPAWERTPRFEDRQRARLEPPRGDAPEAVIPEKEMAASASTLLPAPDAAEHPDRDEPRPAPERPTAALPRPAETPQPQIAEETAEARAGAAGHTGQPARVGRGTAESAPAEFTRSRPQTAQDSTRSAESVPAPDVSQNALQPQPLVVRSPEPRESPRMDRASPSPMPIAAGELDESPSAPGAGAPAGRRIGRLGRPSSAATESAATESGAVERARAGGPGARGPAKSGLVADDSTSATRGVPDALVASRSAAGEPGGEALAPHAIRSDPDGAIGKNSGKVPATYRLRTSPIRKKIALDMGANEDSEQAVETSLQWLAAHQHPDGYWEPIESTLGKEPAQIIFDDPEKSAERERSGFNSEAGLTSLAVLAFLGKGYTHEDNPFADHVDRALHWLISQQDSQGFLGGKANKYARMYCHGMATIAIGEAYGMTKDDTLRAPLERAVQYIVDMQNSDGGWRYFKGTEGDISMFGWQLMALKSAKTAGLAVPQATMNRAIDFLIAHGEDLKARRLSQYGGLAAYRRGVKGELPKPSMTAESLFCKQMLGTRRTNRGTLEAVDYLLKHLPQRSTQDLYYWYYGTLALYHHGGEAWRVWNAALRDNLVADQRTDGDFAGSWNPRAPWGDYGGRVFSTALSTLCLEVYYRFLPLYEDIDRLEKGAAPAVRGSAR